MGFDKREITNTKTADLILLKKSIVPYLTSKKLKKRNSSFIDIYKRISEELKSRLESNSNSDKRILEDSDKPDDALSTKTTARSESSKTVCYFSGIDELSGESESYFLKRKISSNSVLEVEIPSFLHDIKNRQIGAKKEGLKENEGVRECISGKLYYFIKFRIWKRTFRYQI